jgi:DNA-binding response OmpR family regulator
MEAIGYMIPEIVRTLVVHDTAQADVVSALQREGHEVLGVVNANRLEAVLQAFDPEAIVLAMRDGADCCRRLRRLEPEIAIVVLVAGHDASDRIAALDAGADDSVSSPFQGAELSARVRAARRRSIAWVGPHRGRDRIPTAAA